MNHGSQAVLEKVSLRSEQELIRQWLGSFETALRDGNSKALAALFAADSHWRDLLAFTWSITPHRGAEEIAASLIRRQPQTQAHGFVIAEKRTPPRRVQRAGIDVIEAIVTFETGVGRGVGVVRLLADQPSRAFQLMTSLHQLKGFEEQVGKQRPSGEAYSRNFGGMNWKDQRIRSETYQDRDPTVLVIGGGQAGLTVAARLIRLGVDTLIIDRHERVGDNWRKRYHSLALHNQTDVNHLPYMPFPESWPKYLPKDMIADWFEAYAWAMEINFWTSTELAPGGRYDEASGRWELTVRHHNGSERTLRPRHLIFANGIVGSPSIPDLPGLKDFKGDVLHTSAFTTGAAWRGKKALVLGTGNSAHDVAQDLHSNGVDTTMVQRGSTTVISIDPSAKLVYGVYEGIPLDDDDLLVTTNTLPVTITNLQRLTARMVELDKDMLEGLTRAGFKWDIGEDKAGHQMKIRRRYGGYYLNAGCAELIISGEVGLMQFDQVEKFVAEGALLKDGTIKPADLLILGTGFVTQQVLVGKLLGEAMAEKVGQVWGLGPDGEMLNMWKRTAQEGLWFVGSSFAASRQNSRLVALQIKAIEEGLLSKKL
jgi:cation diffusion facilitator CzcD-associated flavoprotein CzcO